MKNDFTITNLFSCPIYKIKIDPNSYDKEKILKDIKYNKSLKNTRNNMQYNFDNCDIHHSYRDFDNEDFRIINYEKLMAVYQEIFQIFFNEELSSIKQFNWKFEIVNYSAITEGQWFSSHNHLPGDDFACIHYLNFKNDHSVTNFKNPLSWTPYLHFIRPEMYNTLDMSVEDNSYMIDEFDIPVEEDDMIIFPSALSHQVKTQRPTEEPRITISANMWILPQENDS